MERRSNDRRFKQEFVRKGVVSSIAKKKSHVSDSHNPIMSRTVHGKYNTCDLNAIEATGKESATDRRSRVGSNVESKL